MSIYRQGESMNPKISVIIPVYNMSRYLTRCMESLRKQTLAELEIICVDDCSTDNSMHILEISKLCDPRIKIMQTEKNSGPGAARNIGMNAAHGEYIGFVDPDDFIEPNFYMLLYQSAIKNHSDTAIGNIRYMNKQKRFITPKLKDEMFLFQFRSWRGIFKTDFLRKIGAKFAETYIADDTLFEMSIILNMQNTSIVRNAFYINCVNKSSLTQSPATVRQISDIKRIYSVFWDSINNNVSISAYKYIIKDRFDFLVNVFYYRISKIEQRYKIAKLIIKLYNKTNYRDEFLIRDEILIKILNANNSHALVEYLDTRAANTIYRFMLFGVIPIFSINDSFRTRTYKIFGIVLARRLMYLKSKLPISLYV